MAFKKYSRVPLQLDGEEPTWLQKASEEEEKKAELENPTLLEELLNKDKLIATEEG